MSRDGDAAAFTAAEGEHVNLAVLVDLTFDSASVRLTSAPFSITVDADGDTVDETFLGIGQFGEMEAVQEGAELQAYEAKLSLSGIQAELLSIALSEHCQGRDARVWLAFLDEAGVAVAEPELEFWGQMDTMDIERGVPTSRIVLTVTDELDAWQGGALPRFNDATQKTRFPGDRFFERTPEAVERELIWGKKSPS